MRLYLIATLFLTAFHLKAEKLDTLGTPIINEFTQTICRGDIFEGYNFVGTYRDTFTTGTCDSIRILHLRYFTPTFDTRELVCVTEGEPNPSPFGTTTEIRRDSNGCEFMHSLTVASVANDRTNFVTICQGDFIVIDRENDFSISIIFERDTTIVFEERTLEGCTYTNTYIVSTIESDPGVTFDITICEGESIFWDGRFVSEPGTYFQPIGDCGEFNFLNLSFRPAAECQITSTVLPESPPIRLYPNPASDFITVEGLGSSQESHRVELINIQGQVIASYTTKLSQLRIDVSSLTNGIYITKISTEKSNDIKTLSFLKI